MASTKPYDDDDELGATGIPKPATTLDPETQAINDEFDAAPAAAPAAVPRAARTADMRDRNGDGTDDRDQPGAFSSTKAPAADAGIPDAAAAPAPEVGLRGRPASYDVVPGAEQTTWGDTSRLSGFNTAEWGEGGTEGYHDTSVKNTFGKLASRYEPTPDNARVLVNDPEFRRMFPDAELIDHPTDPKIRFFPGDEPVDVLIASGQGGWGWQPEGGGGGGMAGGGTASPGGGSGGLDISALTDGDVLKKIQAALAAMGRGETPELDPAIQQEFLP